MDEISFEIYLHHVRAFFCTTKPVDIISPLVLQLVFEYLNIKDIRNCRGVSRRWKAMAQKEWGKKSLVIINSVAKMNRYIAQFESNKGAHPNFIIFGTCSLAGPTVTFFSIFGPYIKSLEIRKCLWMGRNFPLILDAVPNLESLTLVGRISSDDCVYTNICNQDIPSIILISKEFYWSKLKDLTLDLGGYAAWLQDWNYRSDAGKIQPFVFQLLMAAPNLETLNFHSHEQNFPRMVFHTLLFRNELKLSKLSKINLRPVRQMSTNELRLLKLKAFPIVNLSMDVICAKTGLNALHGLLASLGGTLRKLRIKYILPEGVLCHFFPSARSLKELTSLTLINYKGNLGFVVELLNLEYLNLDHTTPQLIFSLDGCQQVFSFPLTLRFGPIKNKSNILDRSMYLVQ